MEAPNNPDPTDPQSHDPLPASGIPVEIPVGQSVAWRALLFRLLLLAGIMAVAGFVARELNEKVHGPAGAELALFSMWGCGCSAGLALLLVGLTAGGPHAFAGLMTSILIRTLGPLGLGLAWQQSHPDWPQKNLIEVHVPLFFVSLTVETILVVDIVSNSFHPRSSLGKGRASRNMHG